MGGHWPTIISHFSLLREAITSLSIFSRKRRLKYILLGSHGLGLTSMKYYLERLGAKPAEVFCYEFIRPFYFSQDFEGMVLDKFPKSKMSAYVLASIRKKVPCYQIVRDPVSVMKSCLNATALHRLSIIQTQTDMEKLLEELLMNIPHLMFYFASIRDLVKNQISEFSYLSQEDITKKLPQTLNQICDRLKYLKQDIGGGESVLKGTPFYRCFPHFFEISQQTFVLYPKGREGKIKEIDMGTYLENKPKIFFQKEIFEISTLKVDGYEDSLLYLAALDKAGLNLPKEQIIFEAEKYLQRISLLLKKHQSLLWDEEKIIRYLTQNNPTLGQKIASKIRDELRYIYQESPGLYESFRYTHKLFHFFDKIQL